MTTSYFDRALDGELAELRRAEAGRNNTLLKVAARLYTFVEAGVCGEQLITDTLASEAAALGLDRLEIRTTLRSAQRRAARVSEDDRAAIREKCAGAPHAERRDAPPAPPEACDPPPTAWREAAAAFLFWSQARLDQALDYLATRGLTEQTARAAGLGYNPDTRETSRAKWGMPPDAEHGDRFWLPAGVVIPSYAAGALWRLQVRRDVVKDGQDRYKTITGSTNVLYGADSLRPGRPALLVEGPFDALAVSQTAGDLTGVAASGTSGARRIRWITALALCSEVLVAFDADAAGDSAATYWQQALPNARRHRPYYADPAQLLQDGQDVRGWVLSGLGGAHPAPWASATEGMAAAVAAYWRGEVACGSAALERLQRICHERGYDYQATLEALR